MFSFGIVLWEILTGEEPYANMHYGAIIGTSTVFAFLFYSTNDGCKVANSARYYSMTNDISGYYYCLLFLIFA